MKKMICCIAVFAMLLSGCGQMQDGTSIQLKEESEEEGDEQPMKVLFNGMEYDVVLD